MTDKPETVSQPVLRANNNLSLSVGYKTICLLLLAVIAAMLLLWRPWSVPSTNNARTIKVTGEAKIKASPDEFVFSPTYEAQNTDKPAALKELANKANEVTAGIKKLGVPDNKIKSSTSGYDYPTYYDNTSTPTAQTYSVYFTITVSNAIDAQKVQDYLITTTPTGGVSPNAQFSATKQKSLESKARDEATKDARSKAEQSARNLGFKIGAVKSVEDSSFDGGIMPLAAGANSANTAQDTTSKLAVQPGENELNYTVTVTYYVR